MYIYLLNVSNKKVTLKNCAAFTTCISRMNNSQMIDAHDFDVVMPMYNVMEYSDNYLKTSGILWQYCINKPALNSADNKIVDFNEDNATTGSFKIKKK